VDGYGGPTTITAGCTAPAGYVADATDCDDTRSTVNPAAAETCNLRDDDCDTVVDEGVLVTFYADTDADAFGDKDAVTGACTPPLGYVADATDCDDTDGTIHPGVAESCDGKDQDCDTTIDDGVTTTFFQDLDLDAFGTTAATVDACAAPVGYAALSTDCDDAKSAVNPGATETCNLTDDDCDSLVDEGVKSTFYPDADGDSFGGQGAGVSACTAPPAYSPDSSDCDDANDTIYPGAVEVCNGRDEDCDTSVDEGATKGAWYADADGDGFGDPNTKVTTCAQPAGFIADSTDCDDTRPGVFPGASERANGRDDDCDGEIDEDVDTDVDTGLDTDTAVETDEPETDAPIDTSADTDHYVVFSGGACATGGSAALQVSWVGMLGFLFLRRRR
jgi:large repetitive protein